MPKMKTRKAAKKRFSITGTGKVRRNKAFANHILTKKSPKRKRNFRGSALVHPTQVKKIKAMIA
ncbi:MAG: 50S ribosomal protein L35 [Chitinispirillales bacterium]|jgi:large subunit ribosomal protein L35|nr:50S ribosomal protein L35 [Chitinispirillales bacterium]